MLEYRDYTRGELLTWCRFSSLALLGSLLAYTAEREGTLDNALDFVARRLGDLFAGSMGVEAAMLGLRLSLDALGAEVRSVMVNPEEGELIVGNLPSAGLVERLGDDFEISATPEEILALLGLSQEQLNRLYDLLGQAAAGDRLGYEREEVAGGQRLTLRA
jgi:hypothetical protein